MNYPDETLMAFADGEVTPELAAEIAAAAAGDAALAARIALFRDSRDMVAQDIGYPAAPENDPMVALIRRLDRQMQAPAEAPMGENVVAFRPARQLPFWQLPLAASVALAVGVAATLMLQGGPAGVGAGRDIANLSLAPDDAVSRVLATAPSGARETIADGSVQVIASFLTQDGALCREFELDDAGGRTVVSVACRDDQAWRLQLAILAQSDDTGYAPASSLESLDAWLLATGASAPLSAAEETEALAALSD